MSGTKTCRWLSTQPASTVKYDNIKEICNNLASINVIIEEDEMMHVYLWG